jgi:outer membrane immunogenic protein
MKRTLLAALAASVSVACSVGIAHAADLGTPYVKAPPGFDWTGLYFGGHGGWAQANFDFFTAITTTPNQSSKGGFGGVQAGYNVQHRNIVLGVEADASFGHLSDLVPDGNFITETTDIKAFGSARARLGYAFGRILPYVTGGLGWATDTAGENCPAGAQFAHCKATGPYHVESTETHFGWTAGGGLEMALDRGWSVKAEYLHADLGSKFYPFQVPISFPRAPALTMDIVKAGVNWRLPY